jgi:UDP-glucose 4-epimerase
VVDRLLAAGYGVRVLERPRVEPYRIFQSTEPIEWATGDLLNNHDVMHAMSGVESVIHLVSSTLPKGSNDDPIYDVQSNLVGTLHILNAMVQSRVRRFVFISSGGTVYGPPQYVPIDENHPTEPFVSYGITKLAIEKYVRLFQQLYGISAVTLRVSNPYGERQRIETAQGAIAVFLYRALRGECIDVWGDGSVIRDYVYVGDVADAFIAALRYEGSEGIFNIGSGTGKSLNQLIFAIEHMLGRPVERRYLTSRPFDVKENVLDVRRAEQHLGWRAHVTIEDGLARTMAWLKARIFRS